MFLHEEKLLVLTSRTSVQNFKKILNQPVSDREKTTKRLVAKTKKSDNSSPKLAKNLKCLENDVAKDNSEKNETISLRRSSRI